MKFFTLFFFILIQNAFALEKVELYLKWKHQFQFAGYYAAIEKGYYKQEGLDVNLIERDITQNVSKLVLEKTGRYGISDSSIVYDYLLGKELIVISSIFQRSPIIFVTRKEDKLIGPLDLKGKRVMYQKNVDDAAFKIMFENAGLNEEEIIHVKHSMNNDDLINKKVDAISVYSTNQPYYFKQKGIDIHVIEPINYGADMYGDTLFTSKDEALENTERVAAFKRASIKGWYYALENPEEIVNLIKEKYNPDIDIDKLKFEAKETTKIIRSDLVPIGHTSSGRLSRISIYYEEHKNLKPKNLDNLIFETFIENTSHKIQKSMINKFIIALSIFVLSFIIIAIFNRRLKYEVNKKTKRLEELLKEKNSFFTIMTHELRTPLNGIIGALYFLSEAKDEDKRNQYINSISHSSNILLDLVNNILDFSKFEIQEMKLIEKNHHIKSIIESNLVTLRTMAKNKGLDFTVNNDIQEDLWGKIDSTKFSQLVNNIIGNAIKFTDKGEVSIQFHTSLDGDNLRIHCEVVDTGIGISVDNINELFTPFKQIHQKERAQVKGTGLGLAISQRIVNLMNGNIEIKKNSDKGITCKFDIEIQEYYNAPIPSPLTNVKKEEKFPDLKDLNILIAEDNKINQMLLSKFFEKFNATPIFADNGKIALEKLEEQKFDLLFLDKQMPIMDGIETCQRIRANSSDEISSIYIVGQSADWTGELDPECRDIGMNATLAKPTKIDDIKNVINKFLNERSQKA